MPEAVINGQRLFYQNQGHGSPALVCLHGISSNSRSWRHQLAGLSQRFRVIAWDAPGYGQSVDVPALDGLAGFAHYLAGLLDWLKLDQAVIVGLSMGGVIAQEFYRLYPDRVLALVLADTNSGGGSRPEPERRARLEARLRALDTLTPAQLAAERAPALLSPGAAEELKLEVISMVAQIHPAGYRQAALALDAADTRAVLPQIKVPSLVLWGEHDNITPRAEAENIYQAIPGARLTVLVGAGHLSNMEQPAAFNQALTSFLTEVLSHQDSF